MSITAIATKTLGTTEQVKVTRNGDNSLEWQRLLATTGDTSNNSTAIANVASTNGLFKGCPISGTGIPAGATVADFTANSITLSAAATATGTGVALTINKTQAANGSFPKAHRYSGGDPFVDGLVKALLSLP